MCHFLYSFPRPVDAVRFCLVAQVWEVGVHWILGLFLNENVLHTITQVAMLSSRVQWAPEMENFPESRTVMRQMANVDSSAEMSADADFTESPHTGTGLNS